MTACMCWARDNGLCDWCYAALTRSMPADPSGDEGCIQRIAPPGVPLRVLIGTDLRLTRQGVRRLHRGTVRCCTGPAVNLGGDTWWLTAYYGSRDGHGVHEWRARHPFAGGLVGPWQGRRK